MASPRPPRTPSKNKYDDKERVVGLLSSLHLQEMVPFMLQLKRCTRGRRSLSLPAVPAELAFHTSDLSGALGAMGSPLRDPGSCALSFCSTGSAAALVWVVSRALPGVQLLRLGKRGADHLPATQPIVTPQDFYRAGGGGGGQQRQQRRAPSPYGLMVWNRFQGGPDVCTREMLLYLAYVACRLAKNRPRATTAVDPPELFLEKLHAFEASEARTEACETPLSERELKEKGASWSRLQRPGRRGARASASASSAPSSSEALQVVLPPGKGEELAQQYGLADPPHTVGEFGAAMRGKGFPVADELLLRMCGMSPSDSPARKRSKH